MYSDVSAPFKNCCANAVSGVVAMLPRIPRNVSHEIGYMEAISSNYSLLSGRILDHHKLHVLSPME